MVGDLDQRRCVASLRISGPSARHWLLRGRPRRGAGSGDDDSLRLFYLLFRRDSFTPQHGAATSFLESALAEGRHVLRLTYTAHDMAPFAQDLGYGGPPFMWDNEEGCHPRARGFLKAASLSDEWIDSMRSRAFLLEAHHTTHIEGTRLTIAEAADLLAGEDVPGADPDDTRELFNYRDAFEFVSSYLNDGGPITERLILEIHRHLVSGVRGGSAAPGQYRRVQNYVVNSATGETIYTPPPARDVPVLMRELVSWLNRPSDIHPVIASGIAQFQLVHIHPFLDGNGRTSRLLSTLCLYRGGI